MTGNIMVINHKRRGETQSAAPSLHLRDMPIEHLYARYQRIARNLPRRIRWLALIFAPTSTSFTVFTAGLLNVAGALMITAGIGQVRQVRGPQAVLFGYSSSLSWLKA